MNPRRATCGAGCRKGSLRQALVPAGQEEAHGEPAQDLQCIEVAREGEQRRLVDLLHHCPQTAQIHNGQDEKQHRPEHDDEELDRIGEQNRPHPPQRHVEDGDEISQHEGGEDADIERRGSHDGGGADGPRRGAEITQHRHEQRHQAMRRTEEALQDLRSGDDPELPHSGNEKDPDPQGSNPDGAGVPIGTETEALAETGNGDQGHAVDPGGGHRAGDQPGTHAPAGDGHVFVGRNAPLRAPDADPHHDQQINGDQRPEDLVHGETR